MATLEFFGWRLSGVGPEDGRIYFPSLSGLWNDKDLFIKVADAGTPVLGTRGNVPLRFELDGLSVVIELGGKAQVEERAPEVWRLRPAKDQVLLGIGSRTSELYNHWFPVGPSQLGGKTWPPYEFGADGEAIIGLKDVAQQPAFLVSSETEENHANALSVMLGPKPMTVNLAKRLISMAAGALTASLNARRGKATSPDDVRVEFECAAYALTFVQLRARGPLKLMFAQRKQEPVPLNIRPVGAKPVPGIEALDCALELQLERSTTEAAAAVTDASLLPADGKDLVLRLRGALNSRNQPEEWTTKSRVGLAFRTGWATDQTWSSPLIRPGQSVTGLRRRNGEVKGKQKVLPMHGAIPGAQFRLSAASRGVLVVSLPSGEPDKPLPTKEWRGDRINKLSWARSRPMLQLLQAEFLHARPGDAYVDSPPWVFAAASGKVCGALPALPSDHWRDGPDDVVRAARSEVDRSFADLILQRMSGGHETGLRDTTDALGAATPRILRVVPQSTQGQGGQRHALVLQEHTKQLALTRPLALPMQAIASAAAPLVAVDGGIELKVKAPAGQSGFEYAICWPGAKSVNQAATFDLNEWAGKIMVQIDPTVPIGVGDIREDRTRPNTLPFAILKLTRQRGLGDILRDDLAAASPALRSDANAAIARVMQAIQETDPQVALPDWVGLVALSVPMDFSKFTALETTIPLGNTECPRLDFLALSPRQPALVSAAERIPGDATMSAAVRWESPLASKKVSPDYDQATSEVSFWPLRLDIRFRQSRMSAFRAEMSLEFRSLFGMGNPYRMAAVSENKNILLLGSARRIDQSRADSPVEFRFAAEAADPIRIFPLGNAGKGNDESFLEGAWFKRLELVDVPGEPGPPPKRATEVRIDGEIELRKPSSLGGYGAIFSKIQGRRISFSKLGIRLMGLPSLTPRMMEISYPSLAFNLDLPHVNLLGDALRMKLQQLALNWSGGFEFPGGLDFGLSANWDPKLPNVFFNARIDFGSMPALFARSLSGFSLDIGLGLNFDKDAASVGKGRHIALKGFGFDGLNFDLLPFLQVSAEKVALGVLKGGNGAALSVTKASVKILSFEIFNQVSGGFFSASSKEGNPQAGDGFWAYFPKRTGGSFLFAFEWGFIAKNVDFDAALPKALLVPPPPNETLSQANESQNKSKELVTLWDQGRIGPARDAAGRGWTFAAGLSMLGGGLQGRALIQDSGFAGLSLFGPQLKEWFGYDLSFCGIYRRNITPGQDYYFISTTLPAVAIGTIRFTGGVIAIEMYTSGDFMVDFGFPWPGVSGGREWRRTIGAIVTPGQASAGFYLRKRETALKAGGRHLSVSAGFAIQWGLGATFGNGVFSAWIRIGLYAVLEGAADLRLGNDAKLLSLVVSGAGGVLVEGEGSINWWVISCRVYVCASAEVRMQLAWYSKDHPETPNPGNDITRMSLHAELYVSASAQACVGGGWFKLCRSITVGLTIPAKYELEFA